MQQTFRTTSFNVLKLGRDNLYVHSAVAVMGSSVKEAMSLTGTRGGGQRRRRLHLQSAEAAHGPRWETDPVLAVQAAWPQSGALQWIAPARHSGKAVLMESSAWNASCKWQASRSYLLRLDQFAITTVRKSAALG